MKREVFNQYVELVVNMFDITKKEFFKKSKKRNLTEARHMVYYLCAMRPMRVRWIQEYMSEHGYDISHSSIIHGIKMVEDKVDTDRDYKAIVKRFELSCEV